MFHGTAAAQEIFNRGFLIGGQHTTVTHGTAYGQGVYTSTVPNTPWQYGGMKIVMLARALFVTTGKTAQDDCDMWIPDATSPTWRIFRHVDQLLPMYALHWS